MHRTSSLFTTAFTFLAILIAAICLSSSASAMELLTDRQMQDIHGAGIFKEQCNSTSNCHTNCTFAPKYGYYSKYVAINHAVCGSASSGTCINWRANQKCGRLYYYDNSSCTLNPRAIDIYGYQWGC